MQKGKMTLNFSNEKPIIDDDRKSIFLAGPTMRNSSFEKSWRKEVCDMLEEAGFDGIVYIPEFSNGNDYDLVTQSEWERVGLMNCKKILFNLCRELPLMPGLTTNVEFGYYLRIRPRDIILCSPENAQKNKYLEWLYKKDVPNGIIYKDIETAIKSYIN